MLRLPLTFKVVPPRVTPSSVPPLLLSTGVASVLSTVPFFSVPLKEDKPPVPKMPALPTFRLPEVLSSVPVIFTVPPVRVKLPNPAVLNEPPRLRVPAARLNVPALFQLPAMFRVAVPESPIVPPMVRASVMLTVPLLMLRLPVPAAPAFCTFRLPPSKPRLLESVATPDVP